MFHNELLCCVIVWRVSAYCDILWSLLFLSLQGKKGKKGKIRILVAENLYRMEAVTRYQYDVIILQTNLNEQYYALQSFMIVLFSHVVITLIMGDYEKKLY